MSKYAIEFHNVGKQYRLGMVGTGSLQHDINRWWQTTVMRREDPYLRIGEANDRATKGNSDYVWALKDISFNVEQGDVVGIIGKNGAGKSTLLKLLSHITAPSTGHIRYSGRIASLLEVGTGFVGDLTARQNIYMNGSIMGMTKREITAKLDEIVDFAGIERYLDTPVKRFSSGMYVRLGFAVAAHLEPEILVVDEVLAVGDAEFQKKAIGKMQDVAHGQGRTVLFVSHNMPAVRSLCNRGIVLENGMKAFDGDVHDALDYYGGQFTESSLDKIKDRITEVKDYITVDKIEINGTEEVNSTIKREQLTLFLRIVGRTEIPLNADIKMIFRNSLGTPVMSFTEGRYTGNLFKLEDQFCIEKEISLPQYLAKGDYHIFLSLHEPKRNWFFRAEDCATLHAEGNFHQFADPLILLDEGVCGLTSR